MSNFYVYIIESPSSDDFLRGDIEGRALRQCLNVAGIDCSYTIAVDFSSLKFALHQKLATKMVSDRFERPLFIHISGHGYVDGQGNPAGIALTSGELVEWPQLMREFRSVNRAVGGRLGLSLSSCYGAFSGLDSLEHDDPAFLCLVGPDTTIELSDLAIGFSSFYHVLSKTYDVTNAYEAMKVASSNNSFKIFYGEAMSIIRQRRKQDERTT